MKRFALILPLLLLLAACNPQAETEPWDGSISIVIGNIVPPTVETRAIGNALQLQDNTLQTGKQIAVWVEDVTTPSSTQYDLTPTRFTVPSVVNTDPLITESPLLYPEFGKGLVNLFAVYPYSLVETASRNMSVNVNVPQNQQSLGSYQSADIMTAKVTGKARNESPALLYFQHRMSKLTVVLKKGEDMTADFSGYTLRVENTIPSGALNLQTGNVSVAAAEKQSVVMQQLTTDIPVAGTAVSCILVPQQIAAGSTLLTLSNGTITYIAKLPTASDTWTDAEAGTWTDPTHGLLLEAGYEYRLTATIDKAMLSLAGAVTPWQDATETDIIELF